jgi:G3E family GTPase
MDEPTASPLLLVTGFLGSGKTTLINRFLRCGSGYRLGVLVNEFGQIGIDGALLGPGDILELEGGCVCCATGRELWEAARDLADRAGATHIVVETSGIAEPQVLLEQWAALDRALRARLPLAGTLCLVDALSVDGTLGRRAEARHQIAAADRLLLTKLDLCDGGRLAAVHGLLDRVGASAERAAIDLAAPLPEVAALLRWALSPAPARAAEGHGHAHAHEGGQLSAVSIAGAAPLLEGPLRRLLGEVGPQVLRAKGFVRLQEGDGERLCVLQLAGGRLELRPADEAEARAAPAGSALVFIGEGLDEPWLRLRMAACRAA